MSIEHVPGYTEGRAGDDDVGDVLHCLAAAVRKLANCILILGTMATQDFSPIPPQ